MKTLWADFVFDDCKVSFTGGRVIVYEPMTGGWNGIAEFPNPWTSSRREDAGIMGRKHQPNNGTARELADRAFKMKNQGL